MRVPGFKARFVRSNKITVKPSFFVPTFARFEQVCLLLGLSPDAVRRGGVGTAEIQVDDVFGAGPKLFEAALENVSDFDLAEMERPLAEELVGIVAAHFFSFVGEAFRRAEETAAYYCQRAGVEALLKKSGQPSTSLGRELAGHPASEYTHLTEVMSLEQCLTYLMLRTIDDAVKNPEAYM